MGCVKIHDEITVGWVDYPSPIDCSLNLFFYGCSHKCKGCSNPQFWTTKFGIYQTIEEILNRISSLAVSNRTVQICLLGGDPLYKESIETTRELIKELSSRGFEICLYTGYSISTVKRQKIEGLKFVKTGKYIESLSCKSEKTDEYLQFASTNQKLYDKHFRLVSQNGRYYFNKS